jgi:hypothetical protein
LSGPVTFSANASDNVGVVGVKFFLGSTQIGVEDTTAPYSISYNTQPLNNGAVVLTAVARDLAGNTKTSAGVNVILANDKTAPIFVSGPIVSQVTTTGATITWNTNEASDTQVEYGLTAPAYGTSSTLNATLSLVHTVVLSGLSMSTPYHYRVKSRDAAGNLATSGDLTFTTPASGDTVYPTVSIIAPTAGDILSSTVPVFANADDNIKVVGVLFKVDGNDIGAELLP